MANDLARKKLKAVRQDTLREYLSVRGHYQHMTDALSEMRAIVTRVDKDIEGNPIPMDRDRFAAWASLVDKHWRVIDKYLPSVTEQAEDDKPDAPPVSRVAAVVERLLGTRLPAQHAGTVPDGSMVPAAVRAETGGHGDAGSQPGLAAGPVPGDPGQP